jgi:hypothetical protein
MNLELADTDALIAELLGRFEHAVFAGMKTRTLDEDEESELQQQYELIRFTGMMRTCQGLAFAVVSKIEDEHKERREEPDGNW